MNAINEDIWSQVEAAAAQSSQTDDDGDRKKTNAEKFVLFAQERVELFHDDNREAYATIRDTGHTYRITSSGFKDWLCASLMNEAQTVAREQARREAIDTLSGIARHRGEERKVYLRCGMTDNGGYVIDLCQPDNSQAIVIEPGRWEIVGQPPIRFIRNPDSMPLPIPIKGGNIAPLWNVANIPEDMRDLVLAWLLDAMRLDTPFPVLELVGEEGTAKSTTQNALRSLIDPNRVNLRAAPRNREDLCTSASVNWLVSYENLSHLNGDLQDALCTVSTGGGFATRKLYTTGEESTLKFKRPVILNGISAVITQQDLLGRAVSLELPRITHRQEEAETTRILTENYAAILGGVFDLLAKSLALLPTIYIDPQRRPRMADFCKLGMAMVKATGRNPQIFFDQYGNTHRESIRRTIDSSPVAAAIEAYLEKYPSGVTVPPVQILKILETYRPERCDAWPKSGKGMADALRRLSPAFSKIGVEIRQRNDLSRRDGIQWQICRTKTPNLSSQSSPKSPVSPSRELGEHGEDASGIYDASVQGTAAGVNYEDF